MLELINIINSKYKSEPILFKFDMLYSKIFQLKNPLIKITCTMKTKFLLFIFSTVLTTLFGINATAQVDADNRVGLKSLVLYSVDGAPPSTPGHYFAEHITIGQNAIINGSIASLYAVNIGFQAQITGHITANSVTLQGNTNPSVINGNINALNILDQATTAVTGTNFNVNGDVYSNGNVSVVSATATNFRLDDSYTYTGNTNPVQYYPSINFNYPSEWPPVTTVPGPGSTNITGTSSLLPGSYGDLNISGGATVTFNGPGTYIFNSVNITGSDVVFNYDFQNTQTNSIKIIVLGNCYAGNAQSDASVANRVFWEVHGDFTYNINPTVNSMMSNWSGTVFVPNGSASVGNSNESLPTNFTGAIWATGNITIGDNVNLQLAAPATSGNVNLNPVIFPYYPPPADGKVNTIIGSELTSLNENPTVFSQDTIIYRIIGDKVFIDAIFIDGQRAAALSKLVELGFINEIPNGPDLLTISGLFPIANLQELNNFPDLFNYVRPLFYPILNSGLIQSQGDSAMMTGAVRRGFNLNGQGIKVGVMSDSYNSQANNYAAVDVSNGDLPTTGAPFAYSTPVQVLKEYPYGERIDEGRAMLQIVHDVAPGAQLAFRTGFLTAGDFALGINELQAAGCDIVVDDVSFITEPYFKDGVIANAVDNAVSNGLKYFTSAGNFGKKSFEANYSFMDPPAEIAPLVQAGTSLTTSVHDFGGNNPYMDLTLESGNYTIVLQWDDGRYSADANGSITDLDIYLVDDLNNTLFGFNRDNSGNDPLEVLPFKVNLPAGETVKAKLVIASKNYSSTVPFKFIIFRGNAIIDNYPGSSTIVGHANANSSITVGAVLYSNTPAYGVNPPTIASFSSIGGTATAGASGSSVRNKPDIIAPNGVNTSVNFGSLDIDSDGLPNFFGTSASAPHAAAAGALILEGALRYTNENLTATQLKDLLTSTALNMGTPGFDYVTGYGMIRPYEALKTFAAPIPEIIAVTPHITAPPSTPVTITVSGIGLSSTSKIFFNDVELATSNIGGQLIATIPAFTGNPPLTVYNAPITNNGDGGFSEPYYLLSGNNPQIEIIALNKSKRYGEKLPAFTAEIKLDGVTLLPSDPLLVELGLNNLVYTTPATSSSVVAQYGITPSLAPADNEIQQTLRDGYNWKFTAGYLTVNKMPLKITPKNKTFVYGQKITGIDFNYSIAANIDPATLQIQNPDSLQQSLNLAYTSAILPDLFALVNGSGATATALVNEDVEGLAILISNGSGATATALVNQGVTSNVIMVEAQAILDYGLANGSGATATALVNGSGVRSTALVNGEALINGIATVTNGSGATATALVNGSPALVNATNTGGTSNESVAVIVNDLDVPAGSTSATISILGPINLITGITAGLHYIVPAAFINANYEISYGIGNLTITPAPLVVKAKDSTVTNPIAPTQYRYTVTGYQYDDANIPVTGPAFALSPAFNGNGTYSIIPSNFNFQGSNNYSITYETGTLRVSGTTATTRKITIGLDCIERARFLPFGIPFVAHFTYTNPNSFPVIIPRGANNQVFVPGLYAGNIPTVFLPGTHTVNIYFLGSSITWKVKTVTAPAPNNISTKTGSIFINMCRPVVYCKTDEIKEIMEITKDNLLSAFPNPAQDQIRITGEGLGNDKAIRVSDVLGRTVKVSVVQKGQDFILLDISRLKPGTYYLQTETRKTVAFIKL